MQTINVQIDITKPSGRRLLKEIERYPWVAKVESPLSEVIAGQKTYTLEESFDESCDILSDHYKCDIRKL